MFGWGNQHKPQCSAAARWVPALELSSHSAGQGPAPCSANSSRPHFPAGKCRLRRRCHHTLGWCPGWKRRARPLPCSHRLHTGPGLPLPRAWSHGKPANHVQAKLPGRGMSVPGAEECLHGRKWVVIKPQKPPNASSVHNYWDSVWTKLCSTADCRKSCNPLEIHQP